MESEAGDGGFDDDFSEIANEKINRIEQKRVLWRRAEAVDAVEDGGHVHE